MSRADLSRETGLTRVTISDLIAELIADGFVAEMGVREASGPGKPAILVDLDRAGHRIVGIDLSGSDAFIGAVLTLDGDIVARREVPVGTDGDVVETVVQLARDLVGDADAPVLGVGVGTPGIVDDRGVILTAPNLRWAGFDLEGALQERSGLPVLVANDANAAVLAEYTFGGSRATTSCSSRSAAASARACSPRGSRCAARTSPRARSGTSPSAPTAARSARAARSDASRPGSRCPRCRPGWPRHPTTTPAMGILRDAGERLGIALAPIVGVLDVSEIVLSGPPELLDGPLAERPSRPSAHGRSPSSTTASACG